MLSYHTNLFSQMMEKGLLAKTDPRELAIIYDSPFFMLLEECDRHPEKEEEAKKQGGRGYVGPFEEPRCQDQDGKPSECLDTYRKIEMGER